MARRRAVDGSCHRGRRRHLRADRAHLGIDVLTISARARRGADLLGRARRPGAQTEEGSPVDELGPATAKWDYLDAAGNLIAVVYRYDPPGRKKEFRPWDAKRRKMAPPDRVRSTTSRGLASAVRWCWSRARKCAQALIDRASPPPRRCTARTRRSENRLVAAGRQGRADLA